MLAQQDTLTGRADKPGDASQHQPVNRGKFAAEYATSLALIGIIAPSLAIVATLGLYLAPPNWLHVAASNWLAVVFGALFTCIAWLLAAAFFSRFATRDRANARFYSLLTSRPKRVAAHLQVVASVHKSKFKEEAYKEAQTYFESADACFNDSRAGLRWVSGTGYLNTWSMIHRAEEALILIEPKETVVHGALHDKLFIQNSVMGNRDDLLQKLIHAVKSLDPMARVYFEENQPWQSYEERLDELEQLIRNEHDTLSQPQAQERAPGNADSQPPDPKARERAARITLSEVRRAMNDFQDNRWENILHLRNQLIRALVAAELVAYLLLCFVIFTLQAEQKGALIAGVAFYIVGGITGLFGRFYGESEPTDITSDYGLSTARLIATPLFSGLAGIAGAFITVVLTVLSGQSTQGQATSLLAVFQLEPLNLFVAAVFGLTPNLVMRSLKKQAEAYKAGGTEDQPQAQLVTTERDR